MAVLGKEEKRLRWLVAAPMAVLAISCVYPILFALNNALKTNKQSGVAEATRAHQSSNRSSASG